MDIELEGRDFKLVVGGLLILVLLSFLGLQGFTLREATSTCQVTVKKCHGVPAGDSCLGVETSETSAVPESDCQKVDEIEKDCNTIGKKICGDNNQSIDERWASLALVHGRECSKWKEDYSIDLRSC